ncbi:MAG TPA: ABC transporter permease [Methylocella sp.]|nr:ABC transporter permease [Methylocella sp.]
MLSGLGIAAVTLGSFVTFAPNRLAAGAPYYLWEAPLAPAASATGALCGLALLSFVQKAGARAVAAVILSAMLLWAGLAGAGGLAAHLMESAPRAARVSPGPAFWLLSGVALFAAAHAAQRGSFSLLTRAVIGAALGAGFFLMAAAGQFDNLSIAREFAHHSSAFASALLRHIALAGAAVLLALTAGAPLTVLILKKTAAAGPVFAALGVIQSMPSIALFGVLIAPLSKLSESLPLLHDLGIGGTGPAPAVLALTLYALLPLVRGFYTGFSQVSLGVKEAAAGIGFGGWRMLLDVELPLALPALLSGLRVVTVQAIGLAAVAALIGAGGLGTFIFQGIGQYALDLVLIGAIPIILLALLVNLVFELLLRAARRHL